MSARILSSFIESVRLRISRERRGSVIARVLPAAAGVAVLWALGWRVFGYAAPWPGYAVVFAIGMLVAVLWLVKTRRHAKQAARRADEHFQLKDGLVSWLDFGSRTEEREAFQLHEKAIARKVETLDVASLPIEKPRRLFAIGGVLALLALGLALLPHSAEVRKRLALEELTKQRTAEIRKEMDEAVEELIKQLSDAERELLDEKKLREWSKEIEQTKDAREAEKQLAKIEQEIAQTMQGLEARQDEAMLKLSAEELEKSASADVRQLGKQLDAKDYEKAAEELKDMKPGAQEKMTPEQLQKLKENAAKSKEMARRMSDGAKKRDFGKNNKADGKMGAMKPSDGKQRPMQDMLNELDADAAALDKDAADAGEMDEDLEEMAGKVDGEMDELGKRLGKLGARAKAKGKLNSLRQGLAQARQFSQGKAQTLGLAQSQAAGQGGRQAGKGTSNAERKEKDEFKDNGNREMVKGQDNPDGPSTNSIESAESGTGIAGRSNVAKEREFKQQYESLVHRDDIPESLKLGIREYFEKVHETAPEETK